jgi:hypothetical protein
MTVRGTSLGLTPTPGDGELEAAAEAVARAGVELDARPAAYGSPWRAAALREGAERAPEPPSAAPPGSALSAQTTPGATPGATPSRRHEP